MTKKFYVTTAIDYVNAAPHIGHAFEKVIADAIARYHRLKKEDVFFLTGVDENAQKNVQAAEKAGVHIKEFVDKNTKFFLDLCKKLNISYDAFIRTSEKNHAIIVQKIVKKIIDKGDIYLGKYEGYYCLGCEEYKTERDLVNGKCPEHNKEPEFRKEEAYFFKLSKYQDKLLKIIPKYVIPEERKNEIMKRVEEGLNDLCVSRKNVDWGVDFPNNKNFKVYVWVDALINYISGLKDKEKKYWPADVHVIGKGINWFHSVIWPALLLSAGYELPEKLLVHGYLNSGAKKISKSLGNIINPIELLEKYNSDSVRYSLLKCSVFDDSDYSEELLINRHNNELADKLGNLVSRVSALIEKNGIEKTKNNLLKKLNVKKIEKLFENFEFDKVLNEIFAFIDICNEYVQKNKVWETRDKKILYELADSIKAIAILLFPFIPSTSEKIAKQFGFKIQITEIENPLNEKAKIKKNEILFRKI
jgi:methionyl-tRNA synthetase